MNGTPNQEVQVAQSRTVEYVNGLDTGMNNAAADLFQAQGSPNNVCDSPEAYEALFEDIVAGAQDRQLARYDQDGATAFKYGVRAGMDTFVDFQKEGAAV